ncbi:MAG: penicillin-binding protein activator [Pseudomonadota bacterium]
MNIATVDQPANATRFARCTQSMLWLAALVCALTLAGCETLPGSGGGISATRAERLLQRGDYERAAVAFMQLAGSVSGADRDPYLLGAADAWIGKADASRAQSALAQMTTPPATAIRNRWHIARAGLANLNADGRGALSALAELDMGTLSLDARIRAEAARGNAQFLIGDPLAALATFAQRELWLGNGQEIADNDRMIWDGLLQSPPQALRDALAQTSDATLAGWLALGTLADGTVPGGPQRGLAMWRRDYPQHPALRTIVPGIDATNTTVMAGMPTAVAVLLTSSGRSAIIGQAVRDGMLSAYAEQYRDQLNAPTLRFYDITENGATLSYQQAIDDGAQFVIGPVLPSAVEELATYAGPTVPTLLLNYPPDTVRLPGSFFCFGLAPEDEAAAVAARAIAEGHRRAVAFVPATRWGERVRDAFSREFAALGGQTLTYEQYVPAETDYNDEIQRAMLLTDSVARYRNMRATIGGALQFEPRRRQDVDFIFMAANADSGRRLKPQLRFHYAGDLPVFATSHVNSVARRQADTDLNGVRFTDVRWLVDELRGESTPLAMLREYFPAARSQPRLFALGFDTWGILRQITSDERASGAQTWSGATGTLSLGDDGHIRRQTDWAVFNSGRPEALPVLDTPVPRFDFTRDDLDFDSTDTDATLAPAGDNMADDSDTSREEGATAIER